MLFRKERGGVLGGFTPLFKRLVRKGGEKPLPPIGGLRLRLCPSHLGILGTVASADLESVEFGKGWRKPIHNPPHPL